MKNNRIFGKSLLKYLYLYPIDPVIWAEKVSKIISKAVYNDALIFWRVI